MPKTYTLAHASTCLPDYWGGHHLAHISVPVWRGMMPKQLRVALQAELNDDAVVGTASVDITASEDGYAAAQKAIAEMQFLAGETAPLFNDLEPEEDGDDSVSVHAYFVFLPSEEG